VDILLNFLLFLAIGDSPREQPRSDNQSERNGDNSERALDPNIIGREGKERRNEGEEHEIVVVVEVVV